ncbi:MAG: hypothetical protein IKU65_05025 [Oscillospiraceae bacterium]|nr:hypothetical protein [Oscillospiraceae bacterium]
MRLCAKKLFFYGDLSLSCTAVLAGFNYYDNEERASHESTAKNQTNQTSYIMPKKEARAEFHPAPSWNSPLKESDDAIVTSARKYADSLIDKQFKKGHAFWYMPQDSSSPYDYSLLNQAKAELENFENLASNEALFRSVLPLVADLAITTSGVPNESLIPALLDSASSTTPGVSDFVEYVVPKFTEKPFINAKEYYNHLNGSEDKYVVNSKAHRDLFVSRLNEELEKVINTDYFGYSTEEENQKFKKSALEQILRVLYINNNYKREFERINNDKKEMKKR